VSDVERVSISTDDGAPMPAILARPGPHGGGRPGVLVIHDLIGLSADMERIAARFAQEGYVALVPDFFGPGARLPCVVRAVASLRRAGGAPFDRLRAAHDHLAGLPAVDAARTGVVGFCRAIETLPS
jgi:carboxymethylenebutenolidase